MGFCPARRKAISFAKHYAGTRAFSLSSCGCSRTRTDGGGGGFKEHGCCSRFNRVALGMTGPSARPLKCTTMITAGYVSGMVMGDQDEHLEKELDETLSKAQTEDV